MSRLKRFWKPSSLLIMFVLPFAAWALSRFPLGDVWAALSRLHLWQVLALAALNAAILALFTSRWWLFLRLQGHRLPFLHLVGYRLASFGVSYFTPGPQFGGEPLQVHLVSQRYAVPSEASIAAVSLDKLVEMLANFTFIAAGLVIVLLRGPLQDVLPLPVLLPFFTLPVLPAAYLVALGLGRRPLGSSRRSGTRLGRLIEPLIRAERVMGEFCRQRPATLLLAMLLSLFSWILVVLEYSLTLRFLGVSLDTLSAISLLIAARIAFLLPVPGGLGTLEASQVLVMQALGFDPALGLAAALLARGRDMTLGLIGLWLGSRLIGPWLARRPASVQPLPSQAGD